MPWYWRMMPSTEACEECEEPWDEITEGEVGPHIRVDASKADRFLL